jgi:hypothetical protein
MVFEALVAPHPMSNDRLAPTAANASKSEANHKPNAGVPAVNDQLKTLRDLLQRSKEDMTERRAQVETRLAHCDELVAMEDQRMRELADSMVQLRRSAPGTPSGIVSYCAHGVGNPVGLIPGDFEVATLPTSR